MTIRRISSITLLVATVWAAFIGAAGAANPSLMAYEQGIDDPAKHSEALQIAALDMRVAVVGTIADVTVTAKFSNPGDDVLEGRFTLDLPAGAVVTGYALDVEGTMIEGVLVDPLKARREYEQRVREGIDPGVAAVSRANQFSTTIYPIPSESSRTIRLRFSAPVHSQHGLVIPLATEKPVGRFSLQLHGQCRGRGAGAHLAERFERRVADRKIRFHGQRCRGWQAIGGRTAHRSRGAFEQRPGDASPEWQAHVPDLRFARNATDPGRARG